ncbi:DUF4126 domain-containing protein [Polymorphobacter fuscus]|uniref:DUF4126 family protein n=1 Tax=Sandarakinorhabdus fusca TaxID=1439888 RepID=A0A7C9KKH3_9SPHN|nr:DUF4126 domain-containing protein [Polymorphobacter fuscus]KAB7648896.1 DUF4126 domain-containing protein [Polymorphobacter fuscus]MQT16483.1 DUF4126 family protein [Polymorphobacter fuscus]NJC07227.1 hypothetical protein [Polymorphobacter fuscus]
MTAPEIIGIAASLSLLAGWRLYAAVLAAGLAVRFGGFGLPGELAGLAVLGNWWVLGVAAAGTLAEFLADKVAIIDSVWDAVHTLVRPIGGALLAFAVVAPDNAALGVVTVLLGGGAALAAHGAKAGTRAAINTSPEPVSNVVASVAEDGVTAAGLWLVFAHPQWAAAVAAVLLVITGTMLWTAWRVVGSLRRRWRR